MALLVGTPLLVEEEDPLPVRIVVTVTVTVLVPDPQEESDADPERVREALEDPVEEPVRKGDLELDGQ